MPLDTDAANPRDHEPGEAKPPLIVIADAEGRNVYADAAVRAYTGLSGEALKGHGWLDVLHPDDQTRAAATWGRAVASGGRYEADYRYRRHDGAYRWFHAKAICDRDASGRICRWFIVSEEIRERGGA
ncbi:MAG TPA: PAS domain-containing protein [Azospirillum sp.]|nr:PAS domain-containing protein [Azospirillum sp.]